MATPEKGQCKCCYLKNFLWIVKGLFNASIQLYKSSEFWNGTKITDKISWLLIFLSAKLSQTILSIDRSEPTFKSHTGGKITKTSSSTWWLESWSNTIKGMIEENSHKIGVTDTMWDKSNCLIGQRRQNIFQYFSKLTQKIS